MRIVTWNCAGGLARKIDALESLDPDVAVIQECSRRDLEHISTHREATFEWVGSNPAKGLGVIAWPPARVYSPRPPDGDLRWFLPVRVEGQLSFSMLAVWAMNHRDGLDRASQAVNGIRRHRDLLGDGPAVVAGDFNDSVIWDTPRKPTFGDAVLLLADIGLVSAYHATHSVSYGAEADSTHFHRRSQSSGYHIDYCFIPPAWTDGLAMRIGEHHAWIRLSDHVPLIVDVGEPGRPRLDVGLRNAETQADQASGDVPRPRGGGVAA